MKFTLGTLLLFVTAFAVAFAMVSHPSAVVAEAVYAFHVLAACASLVVARYTTGGVHAYALAFGVFGLVTPLMNACPHSLQEWIWENVTHDGPDALPTAVGLRLVPHQIIGTCIELLTAMFAASLTSSIIGWFRREP